MLPPFQIFPLETSYPILPPPASMRVLFHLPTHSCFPGIPLHWSIEPSQNQGPLSPLMFNKAILCHICSWSHKFHHVYSLVGVLVPGSSGYTGWFILLFLLWDCKPLQLLRSFLYLLHWGPYGQPKGWRNKTF